MKTVLPFAAIGAALPLLTAFPALAVNKTSDLPKEVKLQRMDQAVAGGEDRITGVPGSPSATTTISGKQLPPPSRKGLGVERLVATTRRATQGRAQRAAHHDR